MWVRVLTGRVGALPLVASRAAVVRRGRAVPVAAVVVVALAVAAAAAAAVVVVAVDTSTRQQQLAGSSRASDVNRYQSLLKNEF